MVSGYYINQHIQPSPPTTAPPIQTNLTGLLSIEIQFLGRLDPFGSCCSSYYGQYPLVRDMQCGTAKKAGFSTPALSIAAFQKSQAYGEIAELVKLRFPGFKIHGAETLEQDRRDTEIYIPLGYRKMGQVVYITDSQGFSTNPFLSRNPWSIGDPPAYESPVSAHRVHIPKSPPPPPSIQDPFSSPIVSSCGYGGVPAYESPQQAHRVPTPKPSPLPPPPPAHRGFQNLARCSWNRTPLPPSPPPPLAQDSDTFDDIFECPGPVPAFSAQKMTPVTPPSQTQPTPPPIPCQLSPPGLPSAEWFVPQQSDETNVPTAPQMVPPQLPLEKGKQPSTDSRVCEVKREIVTWTHRPQ